MTRQSLGIAALAAVLLGLSGCSQLVPGINIHGEGGAGEHRYHLVKDQGEYEVQKAGNLPAYRVTPITPTVIAVQDARARARREKIDHDGLKALLPSDVPPEYRIGPSDLLYVTVWDHPELTSPAGVQTQNTTFTGQLVDANGNLFYPYVGSFHVAGMTVAQARSYIADHLDRVIQDPQVEVRVVKYVSDRVEVTGDVLKPGTITLDNTAKGVLQAIDLAGGLDPNASRLRAILVRDGKRYTIDLAGLLSGDRIVNSPALEPGDVLHIPDNSADQVFMLGAVTKQQPLVIQQNGKTLIQALVDAGGLDITRGSDSGVLVFRMPQPKLGKKGEAQIFTLPMSTPEGVFLAGEFHLQPRDVVYVKATLFSQYNSIIQQILPSLSSAFYLYQLTR